MQTEFFAVCRHRLSIDGEGVTTLVALFGCPLHCKYCINKKFLEDKRLSRLITSQKLLDEVMINNIYFLATHGGITFGGGEPMLHSDFIAEFCKIKPKEWNICVETSLNVPKNHFTTLLPYINEYIVDIKDMNSDIYKSYTGKDNKQVEDNLQYLIDNNLTDRITVCLPISLNLIPITT